MITKTATKITTRQLTFAAVLTALGVIIPIFSPVKIVIEPASFTLASHVPIFLAMFISPMATAIVCIGTTLGFLLSGFPLPIVLRATTHVIFAVIGAIWIKKHPSITQSFAKMQLFSFILAIIHALCEVIVVSFFYFGNQPTQSNFVASVLLLVGVGSIIHSIIDFNIAYFLYKALSKNKQIKTIFITTN